MTLLLWLGVGVIGGLLARRMVPTLDFNNNVFAFIIAIVGAIFGGFAAALIGIKAEMVIPNLIIAFIGSVMTLFFYRQYLTDTVR